MGCGLCAWRLTLLGYAEAVSFVDVEDVWHVLDAECLTRSIQSHCTLRRQYAVGEVIFHLLKIAASVLTSKNYLRAVPVPGGLRSNRISLVFATKIPLLDTRHV